MKQERRLAQAGLREIEASVKQAMEATLAAKDTAEAARHQELGPVEGNVDPESGGEGDGRKEDEEGDGASAGREGVENQDPEGEGMKGISPGGEAGVPSHGGKSAKGAVGRPSKSHKSDGLGKSVEVGKTSKTPLRTRKIESFFGKAQPRLHGAVAEGGEESM